MSQQAQTQAQKPTPPARPNGRTSIQDNPECVAYAFVRKAGNAHVMGHLRKGKAWGGDLTLAQLNAGIADRKYIAFVHTNDEGGGLIAIYASVNGGTGELAA